MDMTHHVRRVGIDGDGMFLEIQFAPGMIDRVRVEELFEANIHSGGEFILQVKQFPVKNNDTTDPFNRCMTNEDRTRVKHELDIKSHYYNPSKELNAFSYLIHQHEVNPPLLAWDAPDADSHLEWAKKVKHKLDELLHYSRQRVPLNATISNHSVVDGILLQKVYFNSAPGLKAVGVLARPENIKKSLPAVIALHGHNQGKINTLCLHPSKSNSYYGFALAKRGFVTFSLDQWGWGERTGRYKKVESKPEETFSRGLFLLGETALGLRAWDVTRSIDFLESLDGIVNERIGIIGHSGGGAASVYSCVLDERIDAAVISGHFCTIKHGLLAISHCSCAHVPQIFKWLDIPDVLAARAPKPTFIISGEHDHLFPMNGVMKGYKKLAKVYDMHGCSDELGMDLIRGKGHFFRGTMAYPWLEEKIGLHGN
ncbi:hypothetical protein GF325_00040 [Candidatus Bathyarchaeota archaeon]|nr:hypothetical protein [Candidatus Bathyarchaeota archaeon]